VSNPINSTDAVIEQIDELLQSENLTTRSGLKLVMSAFRGGMVFMSGVDKQMREVQDAYIRFTNVMAEKKQVEEANSEAIEKLQNAVAGITPAITVVKWLGVTVGGLIVILIWSLITGQVVIVQP
jgi:uncharacterized protein YllA (UPF0747 family)